MMPIVVAVVIVVVVVLAASAARSRARYLRTLRDLPYDRRPRGANGIVVGGEGFVLEHAGAPALLLIHGAGDTPQTLRYLAVALHARGFHVAAPLLPGHGRSVDDFARVTADDLTGAMRAAYAELRRSHEWVSIVGMSMGGALAVQLAAEHPELPALALISPYLAMPALIEAAAGLSHVWGALVPAVQSNGGLSVLDPDERDRSLAYGVFTPAALRALRDTMRRAVAMLPRVTAPTLVVQSRGDNRISIPAAEHAYSLLGAREKKFEWVTSGAHIITVDYGRDHVIASVVAWMEARAPVRA